MPCEIIVHEDIQVIETRYIGTISRDDLMAGVMETLKQVRARNIGLLLGDCTGLVGGHSIVDLFYLAKMIGSSDLAGRLKEAVILPELPAPKEDVRFWETKCLNEGLQVRLFVDRESAIQWLKLSPA